MVPYTDSGNLSYLVAYIVPENDRFDLTALKEYMTMYLTEFMIPEFYAIMNWGFQHENELYKEEQS